MKIMTATWVAALFLFGAFPMTAAADTIFACFQENRGSLRYVEGPNACKQREQLVSWQDGSGVGDAVRALETRLEHLSMAVARIESKMRCVSNESTDSTLVIEGCNVHVRDGTGATASTSGLGNVVVGYDEGFGGKSGTHNLIVGEGHEYTSHGGVVAGKDNSIGAPYANVLGGESGRANSDAGWAMGSMAQDDNGVVIDNDRAVVVRSSGSVTIDSATLMEMNSAGPLRLSGVTVEMDSSANMSLRANAGASIEGALLRFNGGSRPVAGVGDRVTVPPQSTAGTISTGTSTILIP